MAKKDRQAVSECLDNVLSSGGGDLFAGIIDRDRRRAGRDKPSLAPDEPPPQPAQPPTSEPHVEDDPSPDAIGHSDIMTNLSYDNMTSTSADKQTDLSADRQTSMSADKQTSVTTDKQADNLPDKETPPVRRRSPPKANANPQTSSLISQRRAEAKALAESLTTTVTLRLPRDLNGWLDEYVHRAWPERVRKQELVIEALRMLFVRRGRPGEEILETDLLPRKEEE